MSTDVRTSVCVDCETPIIGDRLRCPACNSMFEETQGRSLGQSLLSWLILGEIFAAVICGCVLAMRGCAP